MTQGGDAFSNSLILFLLLLFIFFLHGGVISFTWM